MSLNCTQLSASFCGSGTCVENEAGVATCDCFDDAFASTEFNFQPDLFLGPVTCNTNKTVYNALHGANIVLVFLALVFYTCFLKKWSQFLRLIPYYFTMLFTIGFSLGKLLAPDQVILTDPGITVVYILGVITPPITIFVYLRKYLNYQYAVVLIRPDEAEAKWKVVSAMLWTTVVLVGATSAVTISILSLDERQDITLRFNLFQVSCVLNAFTYFISIVATVALLGSLSSDIRSVKQTDERTLKIVRLLNISMTLQTVFYSSQVLVLLVASVSPELMVVLKYYIPAGFMFAALTTTTVLLCNMKHRELAKRKKLKTGLGNSKVSTLDMSSKL